MTEEQVQRDLAMNKIDSNHPRHLQPVGEPVGQPVTVTSDAYEPVRDAHAVCILTEWEEFRSLDCRRMYNVMQKLAFVFAVATSSTRRSSETSDSSSMQLASRLTSAQWLKDMPAITLGDAH